MEEKEELRENIESREQELQDTPKSEESTLEEMFQELDQIMERMDAADVPLEEAFSLYETGMKRIRQCNEKLDLVEKKMLVIAQDGSEVPFEG